MPTIIPLAAMICGTAVIVTVIRVVSRHVSEWRLSSHASSNDEIARRLERIEQMVESTALEVERLGESTRFVVKLLAARSESLHP